MTAFYMTPCHYLKLLRLWNLSGEHQDTVLGMHVLGSRASESDQRIAAAKEFGSPRMKKMALELSEHDLIIAHRAGARKDFGAADFTSRADIIGAEELKVMMGATFHDQADIAMKLNGKLREQCLRPDIQQQRLKQ
jgi:hypothetical protein